MIKTIHRVTFNLRGEERVVLETENLQEAKRKDAQMDVALSLLVEAERLAKAGKVRLPKGVTFHSLEQTLEDVFIEFAANQDGLKRALKGLAFSAPEPEEVKKPQRKTMKNAN